MYCQAGMTQEQRFCGHRLNKTIANHVESYRDY